jgi:DNA polymerase-3 subunit epsilon
MPSLRRFEDLQFAVVDLETTGISPHLHDRVVEVGIVRLAREPLGGWRVTDEFATLVNPGRDIGPTRIHGIAAADVAAAPPFGEVSGDIAARLEGAVIAAHNLRFDVTFLKAEFTRAGFTMPDLPGVCTLGLACRMHMGLSSRKLAHLCEEAGIEHEDGHSALEDARATAHLLGHYLAESYRRGWRTCEEIGCDWCEVPGVREWAPPCSGRSFSRSAAARRLKDDRAYLARLVERLPPAQTATDACAAAYLAVLDRALEDRLVSDREADALLSFADSEGLTRGEVLDLHREYLARLASAARYDGEVSEAEQRDLEIVCELLGLHTAALGHVLRAESHASAPGAKTQESLGGQSVCFTGEMGSSWQGSPITREVAQRLAAEAGLIVAQSVTKRLDLLVVADPQTSSGKAEKARRYGTRIMAEPAFWQAIGVAVD